MTEELKIEGNWRYRQELMTSFALNGEIYITQDLYLRRIVSEPREKTLKDLLPRVGTDKSASHKSININNLFADGWGSNEDGEEEIRQIIGEKGIMDFPKPRKLIEKLCVSTRDENALILDFFAGSATTAHAMMDLNAEDGGKRKFIMVQLPEVCDEKSEAFKAGYETIPEISKERIRRAGEKILLDQKNKEGDLFNQEENKLDIGFKVFKIEDTNINWLKEGFDVELLDDAAYVNSSSKDKLDFAPGFSDENVVYELMLRQSGVPLSAPLEKLTDLGKRTYIYNDSFLVSLEENITAEYIQNLAQLEVLPIKFFFRDSAFGDDIDLKDETFRRLTAELEKNSAEKLTYTVEFI